MPKVNRIIKTDVLPLPGIWQKCVSVIYVK